MASQVKQAPEAILAKRIVQVTPSLTLSIAAKAKALKAQGIDVISLSAGEPDFDTPEFIKQSAIDALKKGMTKYTPAEGTIELRKAIAEKFKRDQGLTYTTDQILVSCGAKHSIFNLFQVLLNEGDEVLIPAPYWLSYPEMATLSGAKSVFIETRQEKEFKLTPDQIEKAVTSKTKILVLNSPSNPTGAVYRKKELEALVPVLLKHPQVWILSDEIYEKLIFDREPHISIATLHPEIAKRTLLVNGHSKAYAMTGWRLGYSACAKEVAEAAGALQSHSTSNPTSFAQAGAVTALEKGEAEAKRMREVYEKRRNLFMAELKKIPVLKAFPPQGAFYVFVNIEAAGMDSMRFTEKALEEARVAVVPGIAFGSDRHIRLSFACSEKDLLESARRLKNWLSKI
jgi:aspartate aminotransferase